jgi:hypothetical protein
MKPVQIRTMCGDIETFDTIKEALAFAENKEGTEEEVETIEFYAGSERVVLDYTTGGEWMLDENFIKYMEKP